MSMTAHQLAMKLLEIPDLGNKPIRFSADLTELSAPTSDIIEMQFGSINIEEEFVEIELEHFNPHGENEDYLAGMIHRLYFPNLLTTAVVVNWCEGRDAYLLEVCRPNASVGPDVNEPIESQWYGQLDKAWGFWVFHLDSGPHDATLTCPAKL